MKIHAKRQAMQKAKLYVKEKYDIPDDVDCYRMFEKEFNCFISLTEAPLFLEYTYDLTFENEHDATMWLLTWN